MRNKTMVHQFIGCELDLKTRLFCVFWSVQGTICLVLHINLILSVYYLMSIITKPPEKVSREETQLARACTWLCNLKYKFHTRRLRPQIFGIAEREKRLIHSSAGDFSEIWRHSSRRFDVKGTCKIKENIHYFPLNLFFTSVSELSFLLRNWYLSLSCDFLLLVCDWWFPLLDSLIVQININILIFFLRSVGTLPTNYCINKDNSFYPAQKQSK